MKRTLTCLWEAMITQTNKRVIENYYYSRGNSDKNYGARWIDRVFSKAMLFVLASLVAFLFAQNLLIVFACGMLSTSLYHVGEKSLRKKRIRQRKEEFIKREVVKKFLSLIDGQDEKEFFLTIRDMLDESGHFTKLEISFDDEKRPIIMEGYLNDTKVGIYCKKLQEGQRIGRESLEEFVEYCKGCGLSEGVYITNGIFEYSSRDYLLNLYDFKLYLADIDTLYKLILKHDFLFSIEGIEKELERGILDQARTTKDGLKKVLAFRRIKAYTALGIVIALYSKFVPYRQYYIFVAIVLLSLSLTALVQWRVEKYKESMEREMKLDEVIWAE